MTGRDPAQARRRIFEVLIGDVTASSVPWLLDEDVLLFDVRLLEREDPQWLLAQLADASRPFEARATVCACTSLLHGQGVALLRRDRLDYLR